MSMRLRATLALCAFAFSSAACFSERSTLAPPISDGDCRIPLSAIGANKTVVAVRDFAFFPDTVRVKAGSEVIWVNCETDVSDYHTSTSTTGVWSSGAINRGQSYARRFDARGNFGYFCEPHPFMRGAVIVE